MFSLISVSSLTFLYKLKLCVRMNNQIYALSILTSLAHKGLSLISHARLSMNKLKLYPKNV